MDLHISISKANSIWSSLFVTLCSSMTSKLSLIRRTSIVRRNQLRNTRINLSDVSPLQLRNSMETLFHGIKTTQIVKLSWHSWYPSKVLILLGCATCKMKSEQKCQKLLDNWKTLVLRREWLQVTAQAQLEQ